MRKDKIIMEGKLKKYAQTLKHTSDSCSVCVCACHTHVLVCVYVCVYFAHTRARVCVYHGTDPVCDGCRLRAVHAKRTGRRDAMAGPEDNQSLGTPSSALKRKRKAGGDSEEEEEEEEDSDEPAEDDEEEEEEEIKKAKKIEIVCEEVNFE